MRESIEMEIQSGKIVLVVLRKNEFGACMNSFGGLYNGRNLVGTNDGWDSSLNPLLHQSVFIHAVMILTCLFH